MDGETKALRIAEDLIRLFEERDGSKRPHSKPYQPVSSNSTAPVIRYRDFNDFAKESSSGAAEFGTNPEAEWGGWSTEAAELLASLYDSNFPGEQTFGYPEYTHQVSYPEYRAAPTYQEPSYGSCSTDRAHATGRAFDGTDQLLPEPQEPAYNSTEPVVSAEATRLLQETCEIISERLDQLDRHVQSAFDHNQGADDPLQNSQLESLLQDLSDAVRRIEPDLQRIEQIELAISDLDKRISRTATSEDMPDLSTISDSVTDGVAKRVLEQLSGASGVNDCARHWQETHGSLKHMLVDLQGQHRDSTERMGKMLSALQETTLRLMERIEGMERGQSDIAERFRDLPELIHENLFRTDDRGTRTMPPGSTESNHVRTSSASPAKHEEDAALEVPLEVDAEAAADDLTENERKRLEFGAAACRAAARARETAAEHDASETLSVEQFSAPSARLGPKLKSDTPQPQADDPAPRGRAFSRQSTLKTWVSGCVLAAVALSSGKVVFEKIDPHSQGSVIAISSVLQSLSHSFTAHDGLSPSTASSESVDPTSQPFALAGSFVAIPGQQWGAVSHGGGATSLVSSKQRSSGHGRRGSDLTYAEQLEVAAAAGDPSAEFELGARFAAGRGVDQDYAAAAHWYRKAADRGFAVAQYALGTLYARGQGVPTSARLAKYWYTKAAEQGNVRAMHNVAVMEAAGELAERDYKTAAGLFLQAAQGGLIDSQYNAGVIHQNGLGVPKDREKAYFWYSLAARSGDEEAARHKSEIAEALSYERRRIIDAKVSDWKPSVADPEVNDATFAGQIWREARNNA